MLFALGQLAVSAGVLTTATLITICDHNFVAANSDLVFLLKRLSIQDVSLLRYQFISCLGGILHLYVQTRTILKLHPEFTATVDRLSCLQVR